MLTNMSIQEIIAKEVGITIEQVQQVLDIYRKGKTNVDLIPEEVVVEYRQFFSKKNMGVPGLMGDPKAVRQKLTSYLLDNPSYTIEDILAAAELYTDHIKATNKELYCMHADNFISKQLREDGKTITKNEITGYILALDEEEPVGYVEELGITDGYDTLDVISRNNSEDTE